MGGQDISNRCYVTGANHMNCTSERREERWERPERTAGSAEVFAAWWGVHSFQGGG